MTVNIGTKLAGEGVAWDMTVWKNEVVIEPREERGARKKIEEAEEGEGGKGADSKGDAEDGVEE